jgi:hypothetical protein
MRGTVKFVNLLWSHGVGLQLGIQSAGGTTPVKKWPDRKCGLRHVEHVSTGQTRWCWATTKTWFINAYRTLAGTQFSPYYSNPGDTKL